MKIYLIFIKKISLVEKKIKSVNSFKKKVKIQETKTFLTGKKGGLFYWFKANSGGGGGESHDLFWSPTYPALLILIFDTHDNSLFVQKVLYM